MVWQKSFQQRRTKMQLQTILNRVYRFKSFCYESARFVEHSGSGVEIEVTVRPRSNGRALCSCCGSKAAGYDRQRERRYEFVPLWNIPVYLCYAPRRVDCRWCGVKVEQVPWSEGKSAQTTARVWFLSFWAKLLSWQQVAKSFGSSWMTVRRCVGEAVAWGLLERSLADIGAIGVDEVQWQRGHKYLTLVYQLDGERRRLLYVSEGRSKASLAKFFRMLGEERSNEIKFACSDMCAAYLHVIDRYTLAVNILDRFHIMMHLNKAIDEIRRAEMKKAKAAGYERVLKNSRWCLLKNRENLTAKQVVKMKELLKYNLPPAKASILKEDFRRFWEYKTARWASRFLDEWCTRVMRTDLEPMKRVARMLLAHKDLIMNWFEAKGQLSSGPVEGMNYKVKLAMRKAYGFRSLEVIQTVLYHQLGNLPEREFAHRFW
jgi:transposase